MNGEEQGGAKGSGTGDVLDCQHTEARLCHIMDFGLCCEGGGKSVVSFESY